MRSLDTNVLARFFVDDPDDPECAKQRPAAIAALSERAWVATTVLLELEWVLRGHYRLDRSQVVSVLRALLGIEHIRIEDRDAALDAVAALDKGVDFADALHVIRHGPADTFATFDRRFARRWAALEIGVPIELLR